jgi:hypothetical protein
VRFEHVGPLGAHESSNLVQTPQQVIGAVIRKRGTSKPQHASTTNGRRGPGLEPVLCLEPLGR